MYPPECLQYPVPIVDPVGNFQAFEYICQGDVQGNTLPINRDCLTQLLTQRLRCVDHVVLVCQPSSKGASVFIQPTASQFGFALAGCWVILTNRSWYLWARRGTWIQLLRIRVGCRVRVRIEAERKALAGFQESLPASLDCMNECVLATLRSALTSPLGRQRSPTTNEEPNGTMVLLPVPQNLATGRFN